MRLRAKWDILEITVEEVLLTFIGADLIYDIDVDISESNQVTHVDVRVLTHDSRSTRLWDNVASYKIKTQYIENCKADYLYKLGVNTAAQLYDDYLANN